MRATRHTLVVWAAAGLSFVMATAGSFLLTRQLRGPMATGRYTAPSVPAAVAVVSEAPAFDVLGWEALSSDARAQMVQDIRLSPAECHLRLEEALQLPGERRSRMLKLLLSDWALREPAAAAAWAVEHLSQADEAIFEDLARTWAASDAMALARWVDAHHDGDYTLNPDPFRISTILAAQDPVAWAEFTDMKCFSGGSFDPPEFMDRWLSTPEDRARIGQALIGKPGYDPKEPEALRRKLERDDLSRSSQSKQYWNALFEKTAAVWHLKDPAACAAWLSGFSREAQLAGQYFMERADREPAAFEAEDAADREAARQAEAAAMADAAAEPPPPPRPFQERLPVTAPPSGAGEDQARSDWSDWWRIDRQAAEAFLNSAAWPDDLKFRARARAYSSAP